MVDGGKFGGGVQRARVEAVERVLAALIPRLAGIAERLKSHDKSRMVAACRTSSPFLDVLKALRCLALWRISQR